MAALIALAVVTGASGAAIAGWPKPAGGPSASGGPEVLFTFDDGPHKRYTPAVLDTLAHHRVKGIFFWVVERIGRGGWVDEQKALIARAVRDGHLIASHTTSHPDLCRLDPAQAEAEIDDSTQILAELSGLPILLFRAPYGAYCERLRVMLEARQLIHMSWDIDSREWEHHSVDKATRYIIRALDRLDGRAVVLMHDTQMATVRALPAILDWIKDENRRRRRSGNRPPIRIISGSELIAERIDAKMTQWAFDRAAESLAHVGSVVTRLIP